MSDSQQIPAEAIGCLNGVYYKIGRFNRAYYFNNETWVSSARASFDIEVAIANFKDKFDMDRNYAV